MIPLRLGPPPSDPSTSGFAYQQEQQEQDSPATERLRRYYRFDTNAPSTHYSDMDKFWKRTLLIVSFLFIAGGFLSFIVCANEQPQCSSKILLQNFGFITLGTVGACISIVPESCQLCFAPPYHPLARESGTTV